MTTALVIVAAVLLLGAGLALYGRESAWRIVAGDPDRGQFDLAAPERSPRANDALLCTPAICGEIRRDGDLPEFDLPPAELISRVDEAFRSLGEKMQRVDDHADPARLRFVTWTPGLGFPDTNSFEAIALPNGRTGLAAYARAQIGYSDRGNNRRRLREVTSKLSSSD